MGKHTQSESIDLSAFSLLPLSLGHSLIEFLVEPSVRGVTTQRYAPETFQGSVSGECYSCAGAGTQGQQGVVEGLGHNFSPSLPCRSFAQDEKEKKKEENQLTKSVRDRWELGLEMTRLNNETDQPSAQRLPWRRSMVSSHKFSRTFYSQRNRRWPTLMRQ